MQNYVIVKDNYIIETSLLFGMTKLVNFLECMFQFANDIYVQSIIGAFNHMHS